MRRTNGSRLSACGDFASGENQNEPRQNNGWKEARCRKLHHERGKRRQGCQYPGHHQVACARKTIYFSRPIRSDRAVHWIQQSTCNPRRYFDAKFLTAALVSCRACAACRGFGCARNTATTFHVLYRLQVTNFSLLKSAPNGVNYIDVRRLFLHNPL